MPLPSGYGYDPSYDPEYTGLDSATDRFQSGMWEGGAELATDLGVEQAAEFMRQRAVENEQLANQYTPEGVQQFTDIDGVTDYKGIGEWIENTAVQQAPQLAAQVAMGAVGGAVRGPMGALVGAMTASAPLHLAENARRQKEAGIDNIVTKYGATAANTFLDALAPGKVGSSVAKSVGIGGPMTRATLKGQVAKGMATEGGTEAAQYGVTEAQAEVMPNMSDEYVEGMINNAAAGALMGGGMGGAGHVVGAPRRALEDFEAPNFNLQDKMDQIRADREEFGMFGEGRPEDLKMSTGMDVLVDETPIGNVPTYDDRSIARIGAVIDGDLDFNELLPHEQSMAEQYFQELTADQDNTVQAQQITPDEFIPQTNELGETSVDTYAPLTGEETAPSYYLDSSVNQELSQASQNLWFSDEFMSLAGIRSRRKGSNADEVITELNKSGDADYSRVSMLEAMIERGMDEQARAEALSQIISTYTTKPEIGQNILQHAQENGVDAVLSTIDAVKEESVPLRMRTDVDMLQPKEEMGLGQQVGSVLPTNKFGNNIPLEDGTYLNLQNAIKKMKTRMEYENKYVTDADAASAVVAQYADRMSPETLAEFDTWVGDTNRFTKERTSVREMASVTPEEKAKSKVELLRAEKDKIHADLEVLRTIQRDGMLSPEERITVDAEGNYIGGTRDSKALYGRIQKQTKAFEAKHAELSEAYTKATGIKLGKDEQVPLDLDLNYAEGTRFDEKEDLSQYEGAEIDSMSDPRAAQDKLTSPEFDKTPNKALSETKPLESVVAGIPVKDWFIPSKQKIDELKADDKYFGNDNVVLIKNENGQWLPHKYAGKTFKSKSEFKKDYFTKEAEGKRKRAVTGFSEEQYQRNKQGYALENNPKTKSGIPVLAKTDAKGNITIKKDITPQEFYDYFSGKTPSKASAQKKRLLDYMESRGNGLAWVKENLKTVDDITMFLYEHELSHIRNKDREVYYKRGDNLKTSDKLNIENRANREAVANMGIKANFSKSIGSDVQKLADKLLKSTGVSVSIVSDNRAAELAKQMNVKDYARKVKEGVIHAFANAIPTKDGKYEVFINPQLTGKVREEILTHELGHAIFNNSWANAPTNVTNRVSKEYEKWLAKNGKDSAGYKALIKSKKSPKAAMMYLQNAMNNMKLGDLDAKTREYTLDFEEWFADMAGKSLNGKLQGPIKQFFDRIINQLKRLVGKDSVGAFIDALNAPTALSKDLQKAQLTFSEGFAAEPKTKSVVDKFLDVALDKDSRLRTMAKTSKVPAFRELADLMHKEIGDQTKDNSYWSARLRETGRYENRFGSIIESIPEDVRSEVVRELYSDSNNVSTHTRRVRKLLKDMADYLEKAGVQINRRRNYFPQIVNTEFLQGHQTEFETMMASYPEQMASLAKTRTEQKAIEYLSVEGLSIDKESIQDAIDTGKVDKVDPLDMPNMLYAQLVENNGVTEQESHGQQTPGNRFLNTRIFDFMDEGDMADWTQNYLQQDLNDAVVPYIASAVKRAEFERRFGNDKLINLLGKARTQGASQEQIQQAYDNVGAEMGTYGKATARWLHDHTGLAMPKERSPINPMLQAVQSVLITASNALVLGLSAVTSIVDPIGIAVRTGELDIALKSMKDGLREAFKGESDLQKLAEELGAIGNNAVQEALQHGYQSQYMSKGLKSFNDKMFHVFGLEAWTKTTRLMGTAAAVRFVEKHSASTSEKSQRFMDELGLKTGDVDGGVKLLTYTEYQSATDTEQQRDDRVRAALSEFVDTAILRPTPSQRPLYASDPHWAWFFHLKSFAYSFHKTILSRIAHEVKMENYAPLFMASLYIPVAFMGQTIKDVIKTAGDDDDDITPNYKDSWGFFDYLEDSVNKAGLYGLMQPIRDVIQDRKYGGTGLMAIPGPSVDPDTYMDLPIPLNYIYRNYDP